MPETRRLILRQWRDSDREPFAAMNADPQVMRYFPALLSREASDQRIDQYQRHIKSRGWSNWAVELKADSAFIGFIGLSIPGHAVPCAPSIEIGWRLAAQYWHHGYATEGAKEVLRFGFEQLDLPEIVSFTAIVNSPSRAVMERIGMTNANADFDHPAVPEGNWLRRHCLYRLSKPQWECRPEIGRSDSPSQIGSEPPPP